MTGTGAVVDAHRLGARFVAAVGEQDGPGWRPAGELFGPALVPVLAAGRAARGTTSDAVAGSLLVGDYADRLTGPVLAALYRDHTHIDARLPNVLVRDVGGVIEQIAFLRGPRPADPDSAAVVATQLLAGNLDTVTGAVHATTRVGLRVLRGAVANSIATTLLHMSWPGPDRARYLPEARDLLRRAPALRGLVSVEAVDCGGERWMYTDRATCCLAFRTTVNQARAQPCCSTCPILPRGVTRTLFTQATARYAANQRP